MPAPENSPISESLQEDYPKGATTKVAAPFVEWKNAGVRANFDEINGRKFSNYHLKRE